MTPSSEEQPNALKFVVAATRSPDDRHAAIAQRAYQLYEQRGRAHGGDVDDWLLAERELGLAPDAATP